VIRDAYVMLAQEPWCYTPAEIGRLTDWQIENLYVRPAAKRAEEFRRDLPTSQGLRPPRSTSGKVEVADLGDPGSPAHRNWHLQAYVNGPLRIPPDKAVALYEKQLAQWRREQGK